MQYRTKKTYKIEADGDGTPVPAFVLFLDTEKQERRTDNGTWKRATGLNGFFERAEVARLTRRQLADLIAEGASWLAFTDDEA